MGRRIFSALVDGKYGVTPSVKHYSCVVDLLVRCKCLDEALGVIKEMPFEPSVSIWGRWDDVEKVRRLMKDRGLKKDMGSSSVELGNSELIA
ncbi:pentatricopeptide repeat-containing protein at5g56310 [Phtheirospermum japonicum]|uniref:Pentatricopeptide repeat-containing protein at5g56310 n=1 Tax=Phtheirospermum japonicum TaxID=374723 RepID=A0A830BHI1_9LAMI|nr:pentatricopeptide repeat-containing protein at5g56310 [Phtheirospermum japonicum]